MKKLILYGIVAGFALPSFALAAAYNDVTLNTGTTLSVNGITINIASTALLNQITTAANSFAVTLAPGSTIFVNAPSGNQLVPSGGSVSLVTQRCDSGSSSVTLTAAPVDATTTITITPTATICAGQSVSNGGAVFGGGGGGGGGGYSYIAPTTSTATVTNQTQAANTSTSSIPSTASLQTRTTFKSDLHEGSVGVDVKTLQVWLNAHGFPIATSGPGSSGNETTKFGSLTKAAVMAYQKARGITPQSGYVGPLTRVELNRDLLPSAAGSSTAQKGGSRLSDSQINSVILLLQAFRVDPAAVANVEKVLRGR